jgi:hypothetical protein
MLTRGMVQGFEFNRMVVLFTMNDSETSVPCAISTEAMDRLEPACKVASSRREEQFLRLRERIEAKAVQKFLSKEMEGQPPGLVLRGNDFKG